MRIFLLRLILGNFFGSPETDEEGLYGGGNNSKITDGHPSYEGSSSTKDSDIFQTNFKNNKKLQTRAHTELNESPSTNQTLRATIFDISGQSHNIQLGCDAINTSISFLDNLEKRVNRLEEHCGIGGRANRTSYTPQQNRQIMEKFIEWNHYLKTAPNSKEVEKFAHQIGITRQKLQKKFERMRDVVNSADNPDEGLELLREILERGGESVNETGKDKKKARTKSPSLTRADSNLQRKRQILSEKSKFESPSSQITPDRLIGLISEKNKGDKNKRGGQGQSRIGISSPSTLLIKGPERYGNSDKKTKIIDKAMATPIQDTRKAAKQPKNLEDTAQISAFQSKPSFLQCLSGSPSNLKNVSQGKNVLDSIPMSERLNQNGKRRRSGVSFPSEDDNDSGRISAHKSTSHLRDDSDQVDL